jgi:peptide-methionine (S)-S-oxide reductase
MGRSLVFLFIFIYASSGVLLSCNQQEKKAADVNPKKDLSKYSQATFASGCFWCMEGVFESVKGVDEAVSGYAGGEEPNPTYEQVGAHTTKHAETVQVYYDSSVVSYRTLLKVYFASQDPTQVNGQGPDEGASYRSIIFYRTTEEKTEIEKYIFEIKNKYDKPIAAEVLPFKKFWEAEAYHQDYIEHNPDVPYVRGESIPRIRRFQKQYPELVKPDHKF